MSYDLRNMEQSDRVQLLREIFATLPDKTRIYEVDRQKRIVENKPIFYIDDGVAIYRATSARQIQNIIEDLTGRKYDVSNIYKMIKQRKENFTIYGIKIKRVYEEDN